MNLMERSELEIYTKDSEHYGKNSLVVLANFMTYLDMCQDPLHIFRYME